MSLPAGTNQAAIWKLSDPGNPEPAKQTLLPNDGSRSGESVFDPDKRIPVDPADFQDGGKYRCHSIWQIGTGWLIRPDLVVTGGDVVYSTSQNLGACTQMKCYIGYNGRESIKNPWVQSRHGVNVATTAKWLETDQNRSRDVAFIQINRPFEGNLGTFKFEATPLSGENVKLGIVGYPGDKTFSDEAGGRMYAEFANTSYDLSESPGNLLDYRISTFGGQNGAPILRNDNGRLVSIGTHCYSDGEQCNSGTSIDNKYGNDYGSYIGLFDDPSTFGNQVQVVNMSS
ncbi:uncharacterized protein NECHADRAFT_86838 [Fusarium vanettenii 77-13-4]|uniref:Serine protease n=1 Tax=Fusarium vanettenii (strain ATCC MYA-4622 / CBS 123669 / FGSC 9596 / NRRL 45880 / 77-13-4) TaxID=660122 RepID=C7ZK78_FUSV7|nr:uncharacterized protein NECHADRAFT_86838 [Fusarium vanettenii 77-13-4]EEU35629.1 hypothetical protein NECHADRAFT_86838 [Fusarium vanettenii 77-13-4]